MEGSGPSDEGGRELGVEEGGPRCRSLRSLKPRIANGLPTWADRAIPSREHSSNEAEAEGAPKMRHQVIDAMDTVDARDVDGGRWRRFTPAEAKADLSVRRSLAETRDGSNTGISERTEMMEVAGWPNARADRRHAARSGWARASADLREASERPGLRHFGDLLDNGVGGMEAGGSRDKEVHEHGASINVSSDDEDGIVTGKKQVEDVIYLDGDSPQPADRGDGFSTRLVEAGPSQSSGQSPLRRSMHRPASADAKRPRRIMYRSRVGYPEERNDEDEPRIYEDCHDIVEPAAEQPPVAPSLPEPYNLRRGRNMNVAAAVPRSPFDDRFVPSNGSRGRLGRARLQPGGSSGLGLSDLNNLRRPFNVPSSSGNDSTDARSNGVVNLEDLDSPTLGSMRPENTIVLEDDGESERTRQLAEDERVARELQDSFAREDLGVERAPADEILARMLQAEENSHGRRLPIEQRPVFFAPSGMRALLGGDDDEREARRQFRNELAQGIENAASSSRIVRRGYGRNNALGRMLSAQSAATPDMMNARRVQFPARMGLERRMDVLAALEMAFQEQVPIGLQLAHVDRDFNENDYEMLLALDTDNYRHRGASAESISQLPITTLAPTDVTDEDCSICLETPAAGDVVRRLPCMHVFHQSCIDQWLQCQAVCPVCKAHI